MLRFSAWFRSAREERRIRCGGAPIAAEPDPSLYEASTTPQPKVISTTAPDYGDTSEGVLYSCQLANETLCATARPPRSAVKDFQRPQPGTRYGTWGFSMLEPPNHYRLQSRKCEIPGFREMERRGSRRSDQQCLFLRMYWQDRTY